MVFPSNPYIGTKYSICYASEGHVNAGWGPYPPWADIIGYSIFQTINIKVLDKMNLILILQPLKYQLLKINFICNYEKRAGCLLCFKLKVLIFFWFGQSNSFFQWMNLSSLGWGNREGKQILSRATRNHQMVRGCSGSCQNGGSTLSKLQKLYLLFYNCKQNWFPRINRIKELKNMLFLLCTDSLI